MPTTYDITPSGGIIIGGAADITVALDQYSLRPTLPAVTASASGYLMIADTTVTMPAMEASSEGEYTNVVSISASLPVIVSDIAGGTNSASVSLPSISAAATGTAGSIGAIDARLTKISVLSSATPTVIGTASVRLPKLQTASAGLVGTLGSAHLQLPRLRSAFDASTGVSGRVSVTLPAIDAAATGSQQHLVVMDVRLPTVEALSTNEIMAEFVETMVINTLTASLSHYGNFEFDSMCEFNGKYLGAGPDGLFQLDVGGKDDTTDIDATISTGDLDFSNEYQKRITDFYVGMRAEGDMTLSISADEQDPVEYEIKPYDVTRLKQRRVITAKGARAKYWRFAINNIDGCDFEFDSMNVTAVPTQRRI